MMPAQWPHVLVMHDTSPVGESVRLILAQHGLRVSTIALALDRERIVSLAPDAILIDVFGDELSTAREVLTMLRLDRTMRTLPVFLCTPELVNVSAQCAHLQRLNVQVLDPWSTVATLLATLAPGDDGQSTAIVPAYPAFRDTTRLSTLNDATGRAGSAS
jgi:CheY-like chemotaxis protein